MYHFVVLIYILRLLCLALFIFFLQLQYHRHLCKSMYAIHFIFLFTSNNLVSPDAKIRQN